MSRYKIIRQKDILMFLRQHKTFWERLDIPDSHFEQYFNMPITQYHKNKFYPIYRISFGQLLDKLETMEIPDYHLALYEIKKNGFCLPLRVRNYGFQEPLTLDELEAHLKRLADRWGIVYDKSIERLNSVKEKKKVIQEKLVVKE